MNLNIRDKVRVDANVDGVMDQRINEKMDGWGKPDLYIMPC